MVDAGDLEFGHVDAGEVLEPGVKLLQECFLPAYAPLGKSPPEDFDPGSGSECGFAGCGEGGGLHRGMQERLEDCGGGGVDFESSAPLIEQRLDVGGVLLGGKFVGAGRDEPEDVVQGRFFGVAGGEANVGKGERGIRSSPCGVGEERLRSEEEGAPKER